MSELSKAARLLAELGVVNPDAVARPLSHEVKVNSILRSQEDVYSVWLHYDGMSGYVGAFADREVAQQFAELRYRQALQHWVLTQVLVLLDSKPADT